MRYRSLGLSVLVTPRLLVAQNNAKSVTTTTAITQCATDSLLKWQSCSSSANAEILKCGPADVQCECEQAGKGFECLISNCPSHTPAICASSVIVNDLCSLGGALTATMSYAFCPVVNMNSLLQTLIPDIPSNVRSLLPTEIQNMISPANRLATSTGSSGVQLTRNVVAPSQTGAANKTGGESTDSMLNGILGTGVVVSIFIGGYAAFS